jgi:hypothetical protein
VADLAALVAQQAEPLQAPQAYAALKQLPRVFHSGAATLSSGPDAASGQQEAAEALLDYLLEPLQERLPQMAAHQQVRSPPHPSTARPRPSATLPQPAPAPAPAPPPPPPQVHTLSSALRAGLRPPASFLGAYALASLGRLRQLSPGQLARALYCLARLGYRPPWQWLEAALQQLRCQAALLCPGAACQLLAALAHLECSPSEAWMAEVLAACERQLPRCSGPQLAGCAWALAALQYEPGPGWRAALLGAVEARLAEGGPGGGGVARQWLAPLLWGLARLDAPLPCRWSSEVLAGTQGWLAALPAGELAGVAWAAAHLGLRPPGGWLRELACCALGTSPAPGGAGGGGVAGGAPPPPPGRCGAGLSPGHLAALLWSLGKLGAGGATAGGDVCGAELDAWLQHCLPLLRRCSLEQLAAASWGVAALGHRPGEAWLQQLCGAVAERAADGAAAAAGGGGQGGVERAATVLAAVASMQRSCSSSPAGGPAPRPPHAQLQLLLPALALQLPAARPAAVASVWVAVAELQLAPAAATLQAMLEATQPKVHLLGGGQACRLLYALALLSSAPHWLAQLLQRALAPGAGACSADELAAAVWAVARLRHAPSRAWLADAAALAGQLLPHGEPAFRAQLLQDLASVRAVCKGAWQGLLEMPPQLLPLPLPEVPLVPSAIGSASSSAGAGGKERAGAAQQMPAAGAAGGTAGPAAGGVAGAAVHGSGAEVDGAAGSDGYDLLPPLWVVPEVVTVLDLLCTDDDM